MNVQVVPTPDGGRRIIVDLADKDMAALGQVAMDRAIDLIASSMAKEFLNKHGKELTAEITGVMEEMLDIAKDATDEEDG